MTLLIVEDNAAVRRTMRSIMTPLSIEIYECHDGRNALEAFAAHRPDYVLMDIQMKDLDGIAATEQIRAAHPEAKIIIVTNYDDPALREAARLAGACGYVIKDNLFDIHRVIEINSAG